jgi:DNA-binding MarR family transcriptional regulator
MAAPEPQVQELRRLLRVVLRGLWRRRGPPAELGQFLRRGEPPLGRRHIALLVQVGTEGPRTVSQLAEELGLSLPAASKLARDLEEHDLVYRHEAIEDKRRTVVDLNGQTARHVEGWLQRRDEPLRKTLATLDPGERDAFLKGLRTLADELMRESPHGPVRPDDRAPRGRRPHRHRPV